MNKTTTVVVEPFGKFASDPVTIQITNVASYETVRKIVADQIMEWLEFIEFPCGIKITVTEENAQKENL